MVLGNGRQLCHGAQQGEPKPNSEMGLAGVLSAMLWSTFYCCPHFHDIEGLLARPYIPKSRCECHFAPNLGLFLIFVQQILCWINNEWGTLRIYIPVWGCLLACCIVCIGVFIHTFRAPGTLGHGWDDREPGASDRPALANRVQARVCAVLTLGHSAC